MIQAIMQFSNSSFRQKIMLIQIVNFRNYGLTTTKCLLEI